MNRDHVKDLLRKLFRVGQGRTNEAARARERIVELTTKYGLDLKSVIDHEKRLSGVVGNYWRLTLLTSIAKSLGCRVYDQTEGRRRFAVVSGKWDDVSRTVELYRLAEVRVAVQFTSWWRKEATKPKPVQPTFYDEGLLRYSISSQWPPAARFTYKQERQIKPILLRLMAVSVAETFAEGAAASVRSERESESARRSTARDGSWSVETPPGPPRTRRQPFERPPTARDGSWSVETPPEAIHPPRGRRQPFKPPIKGSKRPPPPLSAPHEVDVIEESVLDDDVDKLVAILGQDEAKAVGEGAIDFGVAAATSLCEIVQKSRPQLLASSAAFPVKRRPPSQSKSPTPIGSARARSAAHVRKVISRFVKN